MGSAPRSWEEAWKQGRAQSALGSTNSRRHDGRGEPKMATLCDRSESVLIDDGVEQNSNKSPI